MLDKWGALLYQRALLCQFGQHVDATGVRLPVKHLTR